MEIEKFGSITCILGDCMEFLEQCEPKQFDLAIVAPPYGIKISENSFRQKHSKKMWDNCAPDESYFNLLFDKSCNQIIWGGNYFSLKPSQGFIVWDKKQPFNFSSAMCEYAWISAQRPAKIYSKHVVTAEKQKIHPTQKPVDLYKWLLANYAKQGDKILDTHGGSFSHAIACHDLGFELTIIEKDEEYYKLGVNRLRMHQRQLKLAL